MSINLYVHIQNKSKLNSNIESCQSQGRAILGKIAAIPLYIKPSPFTSK